MARLALVDASPGTVTAVRAAAGGHEVLVCGADAVPADAALRILDAGASPPALELLRRLSADGPLLVLIDRRTEPLPAFFCLRKPCEIVLLRGEIEAMLHSANAQKVAVLQGPDAPESSWLQPPRISLAALSFLKSVRGLCGSVWIAGEPGTGADRVAAGVAMGWDRGRSPVIWQDDEDLDAVARRLGDSSRVLWVPGLDERPSTERRIFERFLALAGGRRRIVVTTGDERTSTANLLGPSLLRLLSGVALRLPPLRERVVDIVELALGTASATAAAAFAGARLELAGTARRSLETYEWPGNVEEVEAVITRSVLARGATAGVVELSEADLRYAPDFAAPCGAGPPRHAVVVPLVVARGVDVASSTPNQVAGSKRLSSASSSGDSHVESVLSAFAHDIRNPMSTLKTFATLAAAEATGDSGELARLATGAAERIDAHLEFLQRYTEMATGSASPATSRVDAIDVLGDAIESAGNHLALAPRLPLWTSGDPEGIRFIADAVVAESRDRVTETAVRVEGEAIADLSADRRSIEFRIPVGGAAVDRLGKWVESRGLPWRLALARDLARRGGGDLGMDLEDGEMRVRWTPAPLVEEAEVDRDGGQARSADRRRRSRSS